MRTQVLEVDEDGPCSRKRIQAAAAALRRGRIVAFPTETVYGLAVNGDDPRAVARLFGAKGRPKEKALATYFASAQDVEKCVPGLPATARTLIRRFLPGPLTLVLPQADGGSLGIRAPRHRIAQELIRAAKVRVVGTSANLSGQPPATDAKQVADTFRGRIEVILDAGPTASRAASTVVELAGASWRVLREGDISSSEIGRALKACRVKQTKELKLMKIALGADHRGLEVKETVKALLASLGHPVKDFGAETDDPCDYPDFALPAARAVSQGNYERAILVCNSGIGMSITANKVRGVRAALCHDVKAAEMCRRHNDANVLCLGAAWVSRKQLKAIVTTWLNTPFEGDRHLRRLRKIAKAERVRSSAFTRNRHAD